MNQVRLNINDYYSTTDLALAAALSLYFPLEVIDRQNPHKAQFQFKRTEDEELDKLIDAYWHGEMRVEPQAYFNSLKSIKARLYSEGGDIHG